MKRSLGSALIVAGVSLFFLLPALLAENLAPKNHEPPHGSALESPVPPKLTFGSQVILEHLWSPAELKGEASLTQKSPPPVPPKPQTLLPPVPAPWQNSIRKVNPLQNRKVAALTFDLCEGAREISGYDAGIVNYLRAQRVKATFFAGGKWLQSHPEQALQLMADPLFEIGNHSWSHPHFRGLGEPAVEDQILRTQAQYEALWRELARRAQAKGLDPAEMIKIPRAPLTFRFPYGTCSPSALGILARLGLPAIQWDIVTGDPDKHQYANRIARTILSKIQPGSIIICHANGRGVWTAEALPLVIPRLRDLGFTLVTVSELLHYGPALTTPDCYAGSKPGSRSMATFGLLGGEPPVQPFPSHRYVLPSCTLHRLKRSESQGVAAILVAMDPWRTLDYRAEALAAHLSRPDGTFARFTISLAGERAGLLALRYPWLRGVYLELLAIFPPHQGLGLGREIMAWIEAQARPHTRNFWTAVSSFNHQARLFYQNLGFLEVARLENLIKEGYDELLLRKILA